MINQTPRNTIAAHAAHCLAGRGHVTVSNPRLDAGGFYIATVTLTTPTEIVSFEAWACSGAVGMNEIERRTLPKLPLLL